ncbi:colanic acid exporter [compost metagenome]
MESLTEMGITQAIVQRKDNPSQKQLDTLWTFLFLRGVLITIIMIACAPLLAHLFHAPNSLLLIYIVALVPLFRNSASIKLHELTRDRNFKLVSTIQAITISSDFILCIAFIIYYHDPIASILSLLLSEVLRTVVSHLMLRTRPRL